jgi:hypothetical protein
MIRLFTDHPRSVGESYLEHLRFACGFGTAMLAGGAACFVHAFMPFVCQTTGSRTVLALHERLMRARAAAIRRGVQPEPEYLI